MVDGGGVISYGSSVGVPIRSANPVLEETVSNLRLGCFSNQEGRDRRDAISYLARFLRTGIDSESEFGQGLGWKRHLFENSLTNWIVTNYFCNNVFPKQGLDAHFMYLNDQISGHAAYQRKEDDLHIFSVAVNPESRGQGYAKRLCELMIIGGRSLGVQRIRFGTGKHPAMKKIHEGFSQRERELNIVCQEGNWVMLRE